VRSIVIAAWLTLGACSFDGSNTIASDGGQEVDAAPRSLLWWNDAYAERRRIVVTTTSAAAPARTSVVFELDTAALIDGGQLRADGRDFRVVRHHADGSFSELAHWVDDIEGLGWQSAQTRVWFEAPDAIEAGSSDVATYLYYDNSDEDTVPATEPGKVFLFADDFEEGLGAWSSNGRGLSDLTSIGARGGASSLRIDDNQNQAVAGIHRDEILPAGALLFTSYVKQDQTGASFGFFRLFKEKFADRVLGWNQGDVLGHCELDSNQTLAFARLSPGLVTEWHAGYDLDWHRIDVLVDQDAGVVRGRVDQGAWSAEADTYTSTAGVSIRSVALETEGQGGIFYVDNYIVRRWVEPAPLTSVEIAETRP
jgi:hypothetical protein